MSKAVNDGVASLPKFFRDYILNYFGEMVMDIVDDAGRVHDENLRISPDFWRTWNALMVDTIRNEGVHWSIYLPIQIMLFVYWRSPKFLKKFFIRSL